MEALALSITKPYHDLYAFDSREVKCLGVIKDMVVSLAQLPMKSVIMDVVVADITPKFGLLLSRSWEKKVGGTIICYHSCVWWRKQKVVQRVAVCLLCDR